MSQLISGRITNTGMNRLCGAFVAIVLLACNSVAWCQEDDAKPDFSAPQAIQQRLDSVEAELRALTPGANESLRDLLQQLQVALYQHQEAVDYVAEIRQQADQVRAETRSWDGFDTEPPFTIQFADNLRAKDQSLQHQQRATASRLRIVKQAIDDSANELDEHQRAARQAREDAENADDAADRQAALLAVEQEDLYSRILAENTARLQLRQSSLQIQSEAITAALELAQLQIEAMRGKVQFTQKELSEIQEHIEKERAEVLKAITAAGNKTQSHSPQITWRINILDIEKDYWNSIYNALNSADKATRGEALASIRALKSKVDDWVELIQLAARDLSEDAEAPEIGAQASPEDVRRVLKVQNQIYFALEQLGEEGVRGPTLLERARDSALAIWGIELYLAEQTESVDGQRVTTYRAVTLGKLLQLTLILLIGWFALRLLSRSVRNLVARRSNIDPGVADAARSWTFGLGLALLLLYGLNLVRIPFTAFAFLGGTLAIGIGFGAQTLLKNFISGVILTLERPFKVGDLVEVDTVIGYIKRIGLRASVIRHFDGTDTLMPNSTLLENRVSNWTFGDTSMRGQIEVGVAYGSDTREVSRVLHAVADSHGLVLKRPEPTVQFAAFGDNTLNFILLYWFDATHTRRDPLASDLRFMVDKAFTEAGIVMAFPQRDLHFDDSKPLRIEVARARSTDKNKESED